MTAHIWDTIVIGGGAAGLSAAQMLGRSRRRTLVIDAGLPRNRFASHMHGVLGHDGLDPADLLARGRRELERYDVEIREGWVESVDDDGATLAVHTAGTVESARAVVLATGITDHLPDIPGLAERWGVTVAHCPYCHGWEVRDQRIGVLVSAAGQVHLAQMMRQLSARVTVFAQSRELVADEERSRLAARGVEVVDSAVVSVQGEGTAITHVVTANGARHELDAIFTGGVPEPHDGAVAALGLGRTDGPGTSLIAVAPDGATSHPRVWAAGNVVSPMDSVPMAASAGAVAGARINGFLVGEDVDLALHAGDEWRDVAPTEFWEQRYGASVPAWSGTVNATLADAVAGLAPGRSLDLGCGEGADAIHLALAGWDAHGVDISTRAIERARTAAAGAGAHASFEAADLSEWEADGSYDLVTASFFHSPVSLDRTAILRRASAAVAPGGHLLIITHAAAPPWADPAHVRHHTFLDAREEADALALDPQQWEEGRVELVERDATGPDGEPGHLTDGVVLLRRR
ncbi:bifunctional NAD(P)/FAD-dependent oxidoreductase/class I SAM-dependent methyltransferase [Demequina activiva]|uniref:Methyltransferase n=1 Tax=Demequina activiva TaxID=1582364 RepID=A0A919Q6L2_9MICO|nr:bifunctional NAD(P)/FAD-dependent oxidoreductase/class I SAM-dependent methyltransferase [Demequina activiva]GIG54770.1 methyltransferase [Demequina activiva]